MKLFKLFLLLFVISLVTSCSPEVIADSNHNNGSQATNDRDIIIDDGSKK